MAMLALNEDSWVDKPTEGLGSAESYHNCVHTDRMLGPGEHTAED